MDIVKRKIDNQKKLMQNQFAQQPNYFILPSSKPNAACQLPDMNY